MDKFLQKIKVYEEFYLKLEMTAFFDPKLSFFSYCYLIFFFKFVNCFYYWEKFSCPVGAKIDHKYLNFY